MGKPRPGWRSRNDEDPTLAEFFAAAALMSYAFAQRRHVRKRDASKWASDMGELMAREARRRRARK